MKSQEKMIEELQEIGIRVVPVMKALVPNDMGLPGRKEIYLAEVNIEDAYNKYCLSPLRNYDPFSNPLPLTK